MNTGLPTGDGPMSAAFMARRTLATKASDMDILCKKTRAKKSPIGFKSFWLADRSGNNCEAGDRDGHTVEGLLKVSQAVK